MSVSRNQIGSALAVAIVVALFHSMIVGCTPVQRGYRRTTITIPVGTPSGAASCPSYGVEGLCNKRGGE